MTSTLTRVHEAPARAPLHPVPSVGGRHRQHGASSVRTPVRLPPLEPPAGGGAGYSVAHTALQTTRGRARRTVALAVVALTVEMAFLVWLLQAVDLATDGSTWQGAVAIGLVVLIALVEGLRLINMLTIALATVRAKDPVPVAAATDLRVAFITTIVPGKEPISMVRRTLEAAARVHHEGQYDIWLLDEGDDDEVRALCVELGVQHFSRRGVARWNTPAGTYKARTKHGNYNAWLDAHGDGYDVWVSVDTDHVPQADIAERLLGWFRDPDVAFVVGPQSYGNQDAFITRAAESQQYMFHSVLQRAGNHHDTAMFVGTNNAVRITALKAIGGLQDSITEDAATSIAWHSATNPVTGRPWKSVYTPDVLAVGEGPTSWTDYFTQQQRWSRGTNEVVVRNLRSTVRGLPRGRRLHYLLLMSYYPSAAITWVMGSLIVSAYLLTGASAIETAALLWLGLYASTAALQLTLYGWNRRHNTSPFERAGSFGALGMLISVLCAPVYVQAFLSTVRGGESNFVITPKGDSGTADRLATFRMHLSWAAVMATVLAASFVLDNGNLTMRLWAGMLVVVSLLPVLLWWSSSRAAAAQPESGVAPAALEPAQAMTTPTRESASTLAA